MAGGRQRELARADRVLPGVWRLRLPLPWSLVPHVNAWALAAGSGVVLVDTGLHFPGSLGQLELGLHGAGLSLEHVRLLVCTHAHIDHYGQAGPVVAAAGCELWMHPDHAHVTTAWRDRDAQRERHLARARESGVPAAAVREMEATAIDRDTGVAEIVLPDRDLVPGVEVDTDLGRWQVHEAPGHAPSHVVLHQPDRGLLISGDHLLGRVSLYYDYGYTPDPVGEFLTSLDRVDALDAQLCLAGHARPFRDVRAHVEANRTRVAERLDRVRGALADGPLTPYEIVEAMAGADGRGRRSGASAGGRSDAGAVPADVLGWLLSETLCYLRHLEVRDEARPEEGEHGVRWAAA